MFCTKLKDLKLTGECPFSVTETNDNSEDDLEDGCHKDAHALEAGLPICKDICENVYGIPPRRKISRSKINLQYLADSIHRLVFPEPRRLHAALHRTLLKYGYNKQECSIFPVDSSFFGVCDEFGKSEDITKIVTDHAKRTNVQADTLKEALGEELFKISYEEDNAILSIVGGSLKDFLNSFNTLLKYNNSIHGESYTSDELAILCLEKDPEHMSVYYFWPDKTTAFLLPGIIKAAANLLYATEVKVLLTSSCAGRGNIEFDNQPYILYALQIKSFSPILSPCKTECNIGITVSQFCNVFPFHFMFDKDMTLLQLGDGLKKFLNQRAVQGKSKFEEYFEIASPKVSATFTGILTMLNTQFVVHLKPGRNKERLPKVMDFKGQMIYLSESSAVLFLGSPCIDKLEEFTYSGIYLSDIPIHSALRDVVLTGEQAKAQDGLKKRMAKLKSALELAHEALEEEKKKTVDLLFTIFPSKVAEQLWQGKTVQAKKFDNVTMLFSDIVGFTAICSQCTPMQVITMLNELYTRFDYQSDELDVYKMRIGLHSGSVLAGVVGVNMPRYCLFGNNVTLANKFESHSLPRKINISPTTYRLLKDHPGFVFTPRTREDLPANFPSDISGICHFLDGYHHEKASTLSSFHGDRT
ncbi:guanylate cyclase soluble subunit alpha-1 isoform X2 [Protopterus annectens]|uniref:guanylate cyclase soluble subunit alpha-1 isoform X2 n=1 Tax=Protopterus annectens TaxID=7888 RepID=UPI001CF9F830|nr:guanylate cyclase soluble subunit alpha-1 isoform X2 [Protopterus annectens]